MPAIDDDDRPKKKIVHEIGQDLALLSVNELNERIALLKEEIARLEATIASKQALAQRGRPVLQEVGRQAGEMRSACRGGLAGCGRRGNGTGIRGDELFKILRPC